jgi:hypothetical protein
MTNPTSNYGFVLPTATDLVTDLPADFDVALQGVDTRLKALNPETTLGDISYASATANTNTRLGIGTTGQVLAVSGGVPAWSTLTSGGYTLISTTTLSGNSVTISSIPSTYKHLYFTVTNLTCSANDDFAIRFNSNTSTNYSVLDFGQSTAGTFGTGGAIALNRIVYSDFCSANALPGTGEMFISNYTDTSATGKTIVGNYMGRNTTGSSFQRFAQGYYSQTSAISSITVLGFGGATFTTGTIRLWGIS